MLDTSLLAIGEVCDARSSDETAAHAYRRHDPRPSHSHSGDGQAGTSFLDSSVVSLDPVSASVTSHAETPAAPGSASP